MIDYGDDNKGTVDRTIDKLPLVITDIRPQKKNRDRFSLFHKDQFILGISLQTLSDYSLTPGIELTHQLYRKLKKAENYHAIKESCLGYLSRRDHASFELKSKLIKKGYDPNNINQVLCELTEKGWIDDEQFTFSYASEKAEINRWGPKKIRAALYKKGIKKTLADKNVELAFENLQQHQVCVDLALKKKRKFLRENDPFKRKHKIYQYLAGRGFTSRSITEALPTILNQLDV